MITPDNDPYLRSKQVRAELGNVSEMTMWRYKRDLGFPCPDVVINRTRFWRRSTIQNWIAAQAGKDAA